MLSKFLFLVINPIKKSLLDFFFENNPKKLSKNPGLNGSNLIYPYN